MSNVQLSGSERTVVWVDSDSKRIVGFGPEGAKPKAPPGSRITSYTCFHAHELDRWMEKYRAQCDRDADESTVRKMESERPMRNAIRDAILERNKEVDPMNRDLNLRSLQLMDTLYERQLARLRQKETFMAAEAFEAGTKSTDVALQSPFLKTVN